MAGFPEGQSVGLRANNFAGTLQEWECVVALEGAACLGGRRAEYRIDSEGPVPCCSVRIVSDSRIVF